MSPARKLVPEFVTVGDEFNLFVKISSFFPTSVPKPVWRRVCVIKESASQRGLCIRGSTSLG